MNRKENKRRERKIKHEHHIYIYIYIYIYRFLNFLGNKPSLKTRNDMTIEGLTNPNKTCLPLQNKNK